MRSCSACASIQALRSRPQPSVHLGEGIKLWLISLLTGYVHIYCSSHWQLALSCITKIGSAYSYVTHANDPVPRVPPEALDFFHPSGEVHIISSSQTVSCPGQENDNCSDGNSLLDASVDDHLGEAFDASTSCAYILTRSATGPYFDNIFMSAAACPA